MRALVVALLVLTATLAGCSSGGERAAAEEAAPVVGVEEPSSSSPEPRKADASHVHDYWSGAWSVVLLEESVPVMVAHNHLFDEPPREQHTHGCDESLASDSQGGSRKFSLPPGKIVLPGTEALEFLFEWNSPSITGLKLLYRPANEHDLVDAGFVTQNRPLRVNVSPEMADAGHTTQTKWVFFLCAASDKPGDVAEGSVRTSILALRAADLPLDPPHPDAWRGASSLRVAAGRFSNVSVTVLNKGEGTWFHVPIEHGVTVPPGTTSVTVLVNASPEAAWSSFAPENVLVYYRDASVPEWVYAIANASTSPDADAAFEITVDHDMVDGVYARETNWDIWVRLASATRAQTSAGLMGAPFAFEGTLDVVADAHRGDASEDEAG